MQTDSPTSGAHRRRLQSLARKLETVARCLTPEPFERPTPWIAGHVNLKLDKTAASNALVDPLFTPYLIPVWESWAEERRLEVIVMAIEQTGKSSSWIFPLLWRLDHAPAPTLIVYDSDEKGEKINMEKLEPLMSGVDKLRLELDRPRAKQKDYYDFSFCRVGFQGAGSEVSSFTAGVAIGDEVDNWPPRLRKVHNKENLRKRGRSHPNFFYFLCCSPTRKHGAIAAEFASSSRGHWNLRCRRCGELTMPSHAIHNLQFAVDDDKLPVEDSLRLVCPRCRHEHTEADARALNVEGAYIHDHPKLIDRKRGFQWGALASQFGGDLSWYGIARAQLAAGASGSAEARKYFWNSIRGLPDEERPVTNKYQDQILSHCSPLPDPATVENVFLSADTQDKCWKWHVWAVLCNNSFALLDWGASEFLELDDPAREQVNAERKAAALVSGEEYRPVRTVADVWTAEYLGIRPLMGVIDEGGHREKEVARFVSTHHGIFSYKGNNRIIDKCRPSDNKLDLILVKEVAYQVDLLYYLHTQTNRDGFYLHLPENLDQESPLVKELSAMRPNNKVQHGDDFENWDPGADAHDYFDCAKMFLAILDYALLFVPRQYWRLGKLQGLPPEVKPEPTPPPAASSGGWMQ